MLKKGMHMKHSHPQTGLRLLLLPALLWLTAVCAMPAQNLVSATEIDQSTRWKTKEQAIPVLKTQIDNWHNQLPSLQAGSPEHTSALRHAAYYKAIAKEVMQGTPLPSALENALPWAASLGGAMEATFTTKKDLRSLYDEARNLLTN